MGVFLCKNADVISECKSGYYRHNGICKECEVDTWAKPDNGSEVIECTKCVSGQITVGKKSASIEKCGRYKEQALKT